MGGGADEDDEALQGRVVDAERGTADADTRDDLAALSEDGGADTTRRGVEVLVGERVAAVADGGQLGVEEVADALGACGVGR